RRGSRRVRRRQLIRREQVLVPVRLSGVLPLPEPKAHVRLEPQWLSQVVRSPLSQTGQRARLESARTRRFRDQSPLSAARCPEGQQEVVPPAPLFWARNDALEGAPQVSGSQLTSEAHRELDERNFP